MYRLPIGRINFTRGRIILTHRACLTDREGCTAVPIGCLPEDNVYHIPIGRITFTRGRIILTHRACLTDREGCTVVPI